MTERKVQLVIDGYLCGVKDIETGIPQGSPVSPILFIIYLSGVFNNIEAEAPEVITISFVDDIGLIVPGRSIEQVKQSLEKAGQKAIQWGLLNQVSFDIDKTEAVLFSRKRGQARRL